MSTENNIHRLTDDWRMYFNGTYIFSNINGEYRAMYVDDVVRTGDDRGLEGMVFSGNTYNIHGEVGHEEWTADRRIDFRPISGYYDVSGNGRKTWVTFHIPNRTQRKGLDSRNVIADGVPGTLNARKLVRMFIQSLEFMSKPGSRDFYIREDSRVSWKGMEVGNMVDGVLVCNEIHKNKEATLWRLLQTI